MYVHTIPSSNQFSPSSKDPTGFHMVLQTSIIIINYFTFVPTFKDLALLRVNNHQSAVLCLYSVHSFSLLHSIGNNIACVEFLISHTLPRFSAVPVDLCYWPIFILSSFWRQGEDRTYRIWTDDHHKTLSFENLLDVTNIELLAKQ